MEHQSIVKLGDQLVYISTEDIDIDTLSKGYKKGYLMTVTDDSKRSIKNMAIITDRAEVSGYENRCCIVYREGIFNSTTLDEHFTYNVNYREYVQLASPIMTEASLKRYYVTEKLYHLITTDTDFTSYMYSIGIENRRNYLQYINATNKDELLLGLFAIQLVTDSIKEE